MVFVIFMTAKDKDKDSFIGPQEFVVGYSKAPEQPQSSARPICHSHTMMSTGREPATIRIAAYIGAHCTTHCATGDDMLDNVSIRIPLSICRQG